MFIVLQASGDILEVWSLLSLEMESEAEILMCWPSWDIKSPISKGLGGLVVTLLG